MIIYCTLYYFFNYKMYLIWKCIIHLIFRASNYLMYFTSVWNITHTPTSLVYDSRVSMIELSVHQLTLINILDTENTTTLGILAIKWLSLCNDWKFWIFRYWHCMAKSVTSPLINIYTFVPSHYCSYFLYFTRVYK